MFWDWTSSSLCLGIDEEWDPEAAFPKPRRLICLPHFPEQERKVSKFCEQACLPYMLTEVPEVYSLTWTLLLPTGWRKYTPSPEPFFQVLHNTPQTYTTHEPPLPLPQPFPNPPAVWRPSGPLQSSNMANEHPAEQHRHDKESHISCRDASRQVYRGDF